jgi:hypothetical protein
MATGNPEHLSSLTERYTREVKYDAHCANRPHDPALPQNLQATLSCSCPIN